MIYMRKVKGAVNCCAVLVKGAEKGELLESFDGQMASSLCHSKFKAVLKKFN